MLPAILSIATLAQPAPTDVALIDAPQITGVAASHDGAVFVNSPTWHGAPHAWHVAKLDENGTPQPFPPGQLNSWQPGEPFSDNDNRFVCVQSVHVDGRNRLWVLDAANPAFAGVLPTGPGPRLVRIDPATGNVEHTIPLRHVTTTDSYLNDIRVELRTQRGQSDIAYITDSGDGAIIVVDLITNAAYRYLDHHPATHAEPGIVPIIGGREWRGTDGNVPQIHADGLALDRTNGYLYWQALTGRTLYRIPTAALKNRELSPEARADAIERVAETVVTDGMAADKHGRIYFTALERGAVTRYDPSTSQLTDLTPRNTIRWPDSFAWVRNTTSWDTALLVTSAQIHLTAPFSEDGSMPSTPYGIHRIELAND